MTTHMTDAVHVNMRKALVPQVDVCNQPGRSLCFGRVLHVQAVQPVTHGSLDQHFVVIHNLALVLVEDRLFTGAGYHTNGQHVVRHDRGVHNVPAPILDMFSGYSYGHLNYAPADALH